MATKNVKPLHERSTEELKGWFLDFKTQLTQIDRDKGEMTARHKSEKATIANRKKELYQQAKDGGYPKKVLDECMRRIEVGEDISFDVNRILHASGYQQLTFFESEPASNVTELDEKRPNKAKKAEKGSKSA